ncbi:hypothetical protein [Colwellia psychrerythraea]|uniref:Metallo-beta-lactamase domain-containing protein n=1 Tax=Colwellia psychrerythraea TaxID=28229 RepID=A0A099KNC2_COLPS|nr:hypothetical protein [Colwellia psychrerythraea]KGJ91725.1 hypothetical protein GAB14E_3207 [Colwellia psychrerythraea]
MKVILTRYALIFAFASMTLCTSTIPAAWAGEAEEFVAKLKTHYQKTQSINAFSLSYHFLNKRYRESEYWDYQTPDRVMSQRMIEIDLVKKHFADSDLLYSPGGLVNDRIQFQNDTQSYYYETNGSFFGKRYFNEGMGNFDRVIPYILMNVDFLAVRPLLEENNIEGNVTLKQEINSGTTTLIHKVSGSDDVSVIYYEFRDNPLQLLSINNKGTSAIYVYDDYQTTRGITFARSVHSNPEGATEPAYIKFIDQFEVIEQVDPVKLRLPQGYGPEIAKSDGILVSEEIAADLYLVTDSSAWRNSLFKVNGDKIMLFGGSGYPALAEKTIKLINEQFPTKRITSVYVTHPHGYAIDGLNVYADKGIEILADEYSIAAIKAYAGFADDIAKFKFRTIEHEKIIDGANFYVLENMHSKRQSFVHFQDSGIIFQSDFLHIAFDNTIAKVIPNYTRTFIDFIRSKQLKINRIVGNYQNNNISVEVMNKTYDSLM